MLYWPFFFFFWFSFKVFLRLKVFGRENIPVRGGYLIASNHLSNLDPMLLGVASGRKISFMAKESLFKNRFFSVFLRGVMAFPIKRGALDIGTFKEALKRLQSHGLVIFPQGTRQASNSDLRSGKSGVGFLAVKSQVPVVPAFIYGSDKAMPPGSKGVRCAPVQIAFGQSIVFSKGTPYDDVAVQVMQSIKKLSQDFIGR